MKNPPQKKWCDMSAAKKKKERTRIEKAVKRSKEAYSNSQSQRIKRAISDGRKNNHEDLIMDAAMWCLDHRGKPLPAHYARHPVVENLRDGNSAFFRKLADAMESLEKDGGFVISKPGDARLEMAHNWDRWEYEGAKIEVRLAELRELGHNITKSRYYGIIEQDGLKSA
jgi:hypothetical protein